MASEHQLDAWLDLVPVLAGERQRIAGQLVQSLEGATVLLAGAQGSQASVEDESAFVKVTENAYVTIRSLALQTNNNNNGASQAINQSLEASFPSETSTLGTKWMNAGQRFTLHLQAASSSLAAAAAAEQQPAQVDVKYSPDEQLNSGKSSVYQMFFLFLLLVLYFFLSCSTGQRSLVI